MNYKLIKIVFIGLTIGFFIAGCMAKRVKVVYEEGGNSEYSEVYGREIYFYIKGDHWEVGVSLPNHLRIGLGDSVSIELDTDKPYIHHVEHVKKYPPGHLKKKNKMKHNNKKHKWG
jgi:hypothetical protein